MNLGQAQPPLVKLDQSSAWYGVTALSSIYGGANIARDTRTDGQSYRYTVIPLPVVPVHGVTLERLADAVEASLTGRLEDMVDCYRLTVERDGWMDSILRTMAHGLLGMPLAWQGDAEMCSALQDADGTPGDFAAMHPEAECAKIFADGIGLGFGLGQYVLMCWRCGGTEWLRAEGEGGTEREVCKTCHALRSQRPAGARELFKLMWRDARWLFRQPITRQWFYNGSTGMVPFTPGDGEWFLFQTVPDQDIWRNGPWTWGTVAAIMSRDARYDAVNTSAACAPTHIFQATGPTAQDTRAAVDAEAKRIRFGSSITLPGEWSHEIHAAKAEFIDVAGKIIEDGTGMWEVGITGNNHGMKAGPGFANMDVYQRVTARRRAFYANAWIRQIVQQGLVWWARANFGPMAVCPVGIYDALSPEEKVAALEALAKMGDGVRALIEGLKVAGVRPTSAQVVEICQRGGVRVEEIPGNATAKLDLGVDALMACVRGGPALASLQLAPFGDERDDMTLAELANVGKTSGKASPAPSLPAPTGGAAPPHAPSPAPQPAPSDARLQPEEDDHAEDDEDAARLAGEMNAHGMAACRHGRTGKCERCGVKASYSVVAGEDGSAGYRATWKPLRAPKLAAA